MRADESELLLYRLCLKIGCLHPDYLLQSLTPKQLQGWQTYYELEPFGRPADDYLAALTSWAAVMPHVGKRRCTPDQFLPQWGPRDPLRPEDYAAKARKVYAAMSAKTGN